MNSTVHYTTRLDKIHAQVRHGGKVYRANAPLTEKGLKKLREWAQRKADGVILSEYVEIADSTATKVLSEVVQIQEANVIHLEPSDETAKRLAKASFPDYKGRNFKVVVVKDGTEIDITSYWDEGSRDYYAIVHLPTMKSIAVPENNGMNSVHKTKPVKVQQDICVVRRTISRGKDFGLDFIIPESNATKMLPAKEEITDDEKTVLAITRGKISSARPEYYSRKGLSPERVKEIQAGLYKKGLIQKNGALTPAGKNAIGNYWE